MLIFFNNYLNFTIIYHLQNSFSFLYIYSQKNFSFIKILKNNFKINFYLKYIWFEKSLLITNFFNNLIKSWTSFFFNKYIISGKGFKLKKKKNSLIVNFNTSHNFFFFQKKFILQKFNKKKFLLISLTLNNSIKIKQNFISLFIKNIFLKKNIKINRSYVLFKKKKQ